MINVLLHPSGLNNPTEPPPPRAVGPWKGARSRRNLRGYRVRLVENLDLWRNREVFPRNFLSERKFHMSPTWDFTGARPSLNDLYTYNYTCLLRSPRKKSSFFISNGWEGSQSMTTLTYQMTQLRKQSFFQVIFAGVVITKSEDLCRKIGVPKCWDFAFRNHRTFWWRIPPSCIGTERFFWILPVFAGPTTLTPYIPSEMAPKKTSKLIAISPDLFSIKVISAPWAHLSPINLLHWQAEPEPTPASPKVEAVPIAAEPRDSQRIAAMQSQVRPGKLGPLVPNPKVLKGVYPGIGSTYYGSCCNAADFLLRFKTWNVEWLMDF